ncbi:hypothetical protein LC087_11135 [Bacillus carboniphilus]|uniref:WYL domain-containing protein n=1 Tax=Bacillus carboniphilus TaxID=86663 RepID=A0ABY9JPX1_9BACI|nr:hypothetical protein [Bacillus carboniphilus]WLR41451.1 hypothetical protein LC087_11135 [Bacillus carboniphilus]
MDKIQVSIEELLFLFYSEGHFEQGIAIKDLYFPDIKDDQLVMMLECASRSLLAKEMVEEVKGQYKLKEKYKFSIQMLHDADRTIKASKFHSDLNGEESLSFHYKNQSIYLHNIKYNHQVHVIQEEMDVFTTIQQFFGFKHLKDDSEVICTLMNEEFDSLLKEVSEQSMPIDSIKNRWLYKINDEIIEDLYKRKGKMDSVLDLSYDQNKKPELIDIQYIIPGKNRVWIVSRNQSLDLEFQEVNQFTINKILKQRCEV